jgi:hypothetical protein
MQMPDAVYHLMRETPLLQCSLASNVIAKIPPKFFISFNNLTGTLTKNLSCQKIPLTERAVAHTATNISFMYSFSGNCAGVSPHFHIHVSVCDFINIPRIGSHVSCSIIGRSIVGIYKSLTDT